ncbi:MAG: PilN domain-containing protein [Candidatus Saccharimonadales bacterium]
MIQLNLLPDLKKEYLKSQKTKAVVISTSIFVTLAALGLSVVLFIYVTFLQQIQIALATDEIKREAATLKEVPDLQKYLTVQNQLQSLPNLHNEKGMNSRLFSFLNVLNPSPPNNVHLSSLQVLTADKSIVFAGSTATFETFNVFVDTLKNAEVSYKEGGEGDLKTDKMFDQVLVQNSGLARVNNKMVVTYTVKAIYKDLVFYANNTEMTASVPNITTTQSVTQSPSGQPLFDDSNAPGSQ